MLFLPTREPQPNPKIPLRNSAHLIQTIPKPPEISTIRFPIEGDLQEILNDPAAKIHGHIIAPGSVVDQIAPLNYSIIDLSHKHHNDAHGQNVVALVAIEQIAFEILDKQLTSAMV